MGFAELVDRGQEPWKSSCVTDVPAPAGGVLANEIQFHAAIIEEATGLVEERLHWFGSHLSADRRDGAERTFLVAAFADPEVGPVPWRESKSF